MVESMMLMWAETPVEPVASGQAEALAEQGAVIIIIIIIYSFV